MLEKFLANLIVTGCLLLTNGSIQVRGTLGLQNKQPAVPHEVNEKKQEGRVRDRHVRLCQLLLKLLCKLMEFAALRNIQ